MNLKCLAVDSDLNVANPHVTEWASRGVSMDRVDNMTDAIKELLVNDYIFVGINGDATDYMPLLKTMRSVTNTPIMIVTGSFTTEKEIEALGNGADLYARWHNDAKGNVSSVLAHITRLAERSKMPRPISHVIVHNNLLIAPLQHCAFIGNEKLDLTTKEYDFLLLLMENFGCMLPPEEIYEKVWGMPYDENSKNAIWTLVKRLRQKLQTYPTALNYIKTLRDVGYSFDPD